MPNEPQAPAPEPEPEPIETAPPEPLSIGAAPDPLLASVLCTVLEPEPEPEPCDCGECGCDDCHPDGCNSHGCGECYPGGCGSCRCDECYPDGRDCRACDCSTCYPNGADCGESDCETCYPPDASDIHEYSYKPSPVFFRAPDEARREPLRYFGIEVEVERGSDSPENEEAAQLISDRHNARGLLYFKSDGSLSDGFEIVSHPASFRFWCEEAGAAEGSAPRLAWCEYLRTNDFTSYNNTTCGMHVHVSKRAVPESARAKLLLLMARNVGTFAEWSRRRRSALDRWARIEEDDNGSAIVRKVKGESASGRYVALNLLLNSTMEFRLFRGTLHSGALLRNIALVEALCDFCTVTPAVGITMPRFLAHVEALAKNEQRSAPERAAFLSLLAWIAPNGAPKVDPLEPGDDESDELMREIQANERAQQERDERNAQRERAEQERRRIEQERREARRIEALAQARTFLQNVGSNIGPAEVERYGNVAAQGVRRDQLLPLLNSAAAAFLDSPDNSQRLAGAAAALSLAQVFRIIVGADEERLTTFDYRRVFIARVVELAKASGRAIDNFQLENFVLSSGGTLCSCPTCAPELFGRDRNVATHYLDAMGVRTTMPRPEALASIERPEALRFAYRVIAAQRRAACATGTSPSVSVRVAGARVDGRTFFVEALGEESDRDVAARARSLRRLPRASGIDLGYPRSSFEFRSGLRAARREDRDGSLADSLIADASNEGRTVFAPSLFV